MNDLLAVGELVCDAVGEEVGVDDSLAVTDGVAVAVDDAVAVSDVDTLIDAVMLPDSETDGDMEMEDVADSLIVGVPVGVIDALADTDEVAVAVVDAQFSGS